ncbi:MAG: TIGR03086 family metal-binding protein [Ornithinimicrobium sp.]
MKALPTEPAARHRAVAGRFGDLVQGTARWDAPTPVRGWVAQDVLGHLLGWFPGFLEAGSGVRLPAGPALEQDPDGAWRAQADAVQRVLDDPETTGRMFSNPHTGDLPLTQAVDLFYTADVFMHTWDLARATGQEDTLDPGLCAQMLTGMEPMEELIRSSGQYGPRVAVAEDASAQDRLLGFIGRDPQWRPDGP